MCGRYTLTASNKPDLAALKFDVPDRYNIAPQSEVLVETRLDWLHHEAVVALPPWATANAFVQSHDLETFDEKPFLKQPSVRFPGRRLVRMAALGKP